MPVGCGVICRPVIAKRRLSGARHLVGLTVEGWHSQTTYPLRLGTFSTFGPSHFGPRLLVNSDLDHWSIRTFFIGQFGPKNKDSFVNSDLFCWSIRTFCWVFFRLSGVIDPVGFLVHTSAFTAQRSAIP